MDFGPTLGVALGAATLAALFGWLGARPPNLSRGPRMIPYRFLMLLSTVAVILMLAHLVNLAGITTGPQSSRFGR